MSTKALVLSALTCTLACALETNHSGTMARVLKDRAVDRVRNRIKPGSANQFKIIGTEVKDLMV